VKVLIGESLIIQEKLFQFQFNISPTSFFQVNTAAAEVLYSLVKEWGSSPSNPPAPESPRTLLDLCCGTGTIGICMADGFDHVHGVELVPEAIVDAKKNAELNNIENISFVAGSVEDHLHKLLSKANGEYVAVLDPPRSGIRKFQEIFFISSSSFETPSGIY
jgi:tRNA (uracil-5-)-methyltransferase